MKRFMAFFTSLCFLAGCSYSEPQIPAVSELDVKKYMGKWYEYARLPNRFEKDMVNVTAFYTLNPDGRITVGNRGEKNGKVKTITGIARKAKNKAAGELEVSFFPFFYSPYRIIMLADDYRYSVVTGKECSYLWILSRTSELSPEDRKEIFSFLKKYDLPVEKFIYPQQPLSASRGVELGK